MLSRPWQPFCIKTTKYKKKKKKTINTRWQFLMRESKHTRIEMSVVQREKYAVLQLIKITKTEIAKAIVVRCDILSKNTVKKDKKERTDTTLWSFVGKHTIIQANMITGIIKGFNFIENEWWKRFILCRYYLQKQYSSMKKYNIRKYL